MLQSLELTNFGSFAESVRLVMQAPAATDAVVRPSPLSPRTTQVALIYGANASGKTTVLDGLARLVLAVRNSHRLWDPQGVTNAHPFLLRDGATDLPSRWRIAFAAIDPDAGPGVYDYTLVMNTAAVIEESLAFKPASTGRARWLFRRHGQDVTTRHRSLHAITERLRPNALLLSLAAQENDPVTTPVSSWFADQVHLARDLGSPELQQHLVDSLSSGSDLALVREMAARADLGIDDVRGIAVTDADRDNFTALSKKLSDAVPGFTIHPPTGEFREIQFRHRGHGDASFWLPQHLESDGTSAFLAAGLIAARALTTGGVLVIDELDGSLHPRLVEAIVDAFRSPVTNPHGAQLLATTHDTHLFGRNNLSPLSRHEVWFTEKDHQGRSLLFRLSDFPDVRPNVDQEHRYLAGRYGATPVPQLTEPWEASGGFA